MMLENKISLMAEKITYSETGVNFLTAHSSKGLEFDYVYIIACNSKAWDEPKRRKDYQLPDNLFSITGDETEENRRLFYVAMTRAKKQLVMSFAEYDLQRKELEPSRFIAEITEDKTIQIERKTSQEEDLIKYTNSSLINNELAILPKTIIDNGFIDSLLEKYSLSVTHLNHYLKCPISFYFNNFIKVPSPKSASMTFGSAIHFALEQLFKKMNNSEDKKFATEDILLNDFRWFMRRNQDSFTEAEYKRRIEYGEEILPAYYQHYIGQWNKVTSIERSYRNVLVNGVPINGKLDKMEFDGNEVNVVDYKTGAYKNAKNKFGRPNPEAVEATLAKNAEPKFEDKFGGDYWRQAVFYKILMDYDATKKWEMRSSEFDFVEPINQGSKLEFHKEKVVIIPSDIEIVKQQISDTYKRIMNKEFTEGCNKDDCTWCNFTKNYYANTVSKTVFLNQAEEEA
jgi:DNA helicase-2/ATP-dependent DNA helicase PcrA